MNIQRVTYILILLGTFLWCGTILLAPYLAASSSPLAEFVYRFFHPICHQLPERSFLLFGEKLAVCSRCSSIYFAFFLGTVLYPFIHISNNPVLHHSNLSSIHPFIPPRALLFTALLPLLIDVGLDFLGVHSSTMLTRAVTGVLFGIVVPFFVVTPAMEAVQQLIADKPSTIVEHLKGISNA